MSSFPKSSTVDLLCPELEMLLCVHESKLKDKSPNRITVTEKNFTCPLEKKIKVKRNLKGSGSHKLLSSMELVGFSIG